MRTTSASRLSQLAMSLQQGWYEGAWWLQCLRPISWLFSAMTSLRHGLYGKRARIKRSSNAIPVVVIGNITVGGSGKTPLLLTLGEELKRRGHWVAIVSRGYGGKAPVYPLRVTAQTPASLAGDEPVMLARHLAVPVIVDPIRSRAIEALEADNHYPCDVILSDDGLQHYAMSRDIEVVVVDAVRGFGNGLCLPAGPLRESLSRLRSVDFLVSNGEDRQGRLPASYQFVPMTLEATSCVHVQTGERMALREFFRKPMVHGVAGIGHPQRFFDSLRQMGSQVIEHAFPDHHPFVPTDLDFGDALPVVMTEKDAVKCQDFQLKNAWYVEVKARLPDAFMEALVNRIASVQVGRKIGVQKNLFE